jgi:hypothetical protein
MLPLKSRLATADDLLSAVRVKRSCGPDRLIEPHKDKDHVLKMMWKYQESCGLENPMARQKSGMDYLVPKQRGFENEV